MYKLVGHTHSHCDRVFSRIKASLMGKSYISEDDMKQIIVSTLKSYKMEWDHLHASLDFEALNTLLGLDIHHLRNVHDLEIFRTTGSLCAGSNISVMNCGAVPDWWWRRRTLRRWHKPGRPM